MVNTGTSRSVEGGLCAVLAGIAGQYAGYVAFRLFQLFRDWLVAAASNQPRAFEGMPVSFVLVPPPHIWNVAAVAGAMIGLAAYWIHTATVDPSTRKRRRRWFNSLIVAVGILVGRGLDFIGNWQVMVMALDDLVTLAVSLWVTWSLVEFADKLVRRLDK